MNRLLLPCGKPVFLAALLGLAAGDAAAQSVATIRITPEHANVVAGGSARFAAVALDSAGRELPDIAVTWGAAPFDVGWAEQDGTIHALRQGEVHVLAFAGGKSASVTLIASPKPPVTVEASARRGEIVVGGVTVVEATALTEDGEPLPDARVRFESSASRVARVDESGVVMGLAPGSARITARAGSASGAVDLHVIANPVARLEVSGGTGARTGDVVRFSARGLDAGGRPLDDVPVRWSVGGAGAEIFDDGAFVAERPGSYLVTALAGDVAATASIAIEPRVNARRLELVTSLPYDGVQAAEHWAIDDVLYVTTVSDRVYAYDIRNPLSPVLVDSVVVDAGHINDVSTTRDGRIGVITREGARSRRNGIVFLDLSDPLHPQVLSEYTATVTGGVHSAFVDEPYVYLTDDATGSLRVIDFNDVSNPREIARWEPEGVRGARSVADGPPVSISLGRMLHDVRVDDGIAYLSYWRHGLIMLDVGAGIVGGSPAEPREITRFAYNVAEYYPADHIAGTHTAWREDDYLFVGDEVFPPIFDVGAPGRIAALGHLHVLDVSDIRNPVKVAEYRVPTGGVHNFWVEDGVLYLGAYGGGIRAIDVSGELRGELHEQGRELGAIWTGHPDGYLPNLPMAWGAQPHRGVIYATDMNSGLWVARLTPVVLP